MRLPGSLRARVTLGAVAATTVALLLVTVVLLAAVARDGRSAVDRQLRERVANVTGGPPGGGAPGFPFRGGPPRPRGPQQLLAGSGTFVQLAQGDGQPERVGDVPARAPDVPRTAGLATIDIDGTPWRSLTVVDGGGIRLQLLQSLAAVDDRVAAVRRIVLLVGLLALALTAAAAYALTSLAVRPLAALRDSAARVGEDPTVAALPAAGGPDEVRALGATLNEMLARLTTASAAQQRALDATKRFAADAGHELRTPLTGLRANVDVLRRNPELPEAERDAILAEVAAEQDRTVHLLDGLTALARGEAADALPREPVELADLVDEAVGAARRRHPTVTWALEEDVGAATVEGWAGGLRLMLDNLLQNAALHGAPDGEVRVGLRTAGDRLVLRVDDDGPGIPPGERAGLMEPFRRGWNPRSAGSGLGLAIAAQQAALHGGELELGDAPLGGLRAQVVLDRHGV